MNTQAILLVSLVALLAVAMIGHDFGWPPAEAGDLEIRLIGAQGGT